MTATGALHVLVALFFPPIGRHLTPPRSSYVGYWHLEIIGYDEEGALMLEGWETFAAAWFLIAGPLMMIIGLLAIDYIRDTRKPLPQWLGWSFIVIGVFGCVVFPLSGFWLLWLQGLFMLISRGSFANSKRE